MYYCSIAFNFVLLYVLFLAIISYHPTKESDLDACSFSTFNLGLRTSLHSKLDIFCNVYLKQYEEDLLSKNQLQQYYTHIWNKFNQKTIKKRVKDQNHSSKDNQGLKHQQQQKKGKNMITLSSSRK